jgi:hypothetical protein
MYIRKKLKYKIVMTLSAGEDVRELKLHHSYHAGRNVKYHTQPGK